MVKFGEQLGAVRKPEWAKYYLDYSGLKKRLTELRTLYGSSPDGENGLPPRGRTISRSTSLAVLVRRNSALSTNTSAAVDALEDAFARFVDAEVEKVVLFFLQEQGDLASRLLVAREDLDTLGASSRIVGRHEPWTNGEGDRALAQAEKTYEEVGLAIVELLRFLQLNVAGLRKILKKHDKQVRDRLLASNYLASRSRVRYSFLQQLYHNEGVMALVASLRTAFEELHILHSCDGGTLHVLPPSQQAMDALEPRTQAERDLFDEIAFAQGQLMEEQRRTVQDYLTLSSDLLLEQAYAVEEPREEAKKRELDRFSAALNLATTFLYMGNYYVVAPSSAEYAAALGGSRAVSGIIIGMTPIAACFSCIFYSYWSNTSFKGPLLLCAVLLIAGNAFYGLALSFEAFWMALLGRTLIGFGGARGVCRRYIADTIPLEQRTFFSAAFVAVGATGMAFGPFVAALLNSLDFTVGIAIVNGMTAPGWFMFICWSILGVLTLFFFKEPTYRFSPPAKPLASLKRKAAANSAARGSVIGAGSTFSYGSVPSSSVGSGNGGNGEEKNLLQYSVQSSPSQVTDTDDDDRFNAFLCCGVLPLPLLFTLLSYFVNKLVTEAVVSASPLLTEYLFDWGISSVGILMAAMGLAVLPINVIVGRLSLSYDDRWLMQVLTLATCVGCVLILQFPFVDYTEVQYVAASATIFVALQAHEGVIMSITSKIIPPELAKGTFNSGFLATEAGTFARFVGDLSITVLGVASMQHLLALLYIPSLVLCGLMAAGNWLFYPVLDA